MRQVSQNTEEIIMQAAKKIFKKKGLDGATVQDIANEAGTTKSMVNYYFRSKEKLFTSVFAEEFKHLFSGIASFILSDLTLKEKIEKIVDLDIQKLIEFPELPLFVLNEIHRNGNIVLAHMNAMNLSDLIKKLNKQINSEVRKGMIKRIDAIDLLINIQALTIFPFLGKPIMTKVFALDEKSYQKKLQERKKMVVEMIWNYIKNK